MLLSLYFLSVFGNISLVRSSLYLCLSPFSACVSETASDQDTEKESTRQRKREKGKHNPPLSVKPGNLFFCLTLNPLPYLCMSCLNKTRKRERERHTHKHIEMDRTRKLETEKNKIVKRASTSETIPKRMGECFGSALGGRPPWRLGAGRGDCENKCVLSPHMCPFYGHVQFFPEGRQPVKTHGF